MITHADPEWIRRLRRGARWVFWGFLISHLVPNLAGFLLPFLNADRAYLRWAGLIHACMGVPIAMRVFALTARPLATGVGEGRPALCRNLRTIAVLEALGRFVHWGGRITTFGETLYWYWIPLALITVVAVLLGLTYLRQLSRWLDLQNLDGRIRLLIWCYMLVSLLDRWPVEVTAVGGVWVMGFKLLTLAALWVWALTLLHRFGNMLALMLAGKCVACRYMLCELPSPRCPECGRPFTLLSAQE
jgi:hypothetical protein